MRGWVSAVANYAEPVPLNGVMRSFAVGEVVASRHPDFEVGARVTGMFGWQEYAVSDGAGVRHVRERDLPLSLFLGVLGLNGITAYFGLLETGAPKAGETVVVSTAAGAVGSCVGQIAKIKGCRTVGIAGGPVKTKLCTDEFGYDAALDYKAPDFAEALARAAERRHRRLFRQYRRRHQRRRAHAPQCRRPHRDLRHGVDRELGPLADGPAHRAHDAGQARAHAGLPGARPHAPLRRSHRPARRLGARRQDPLSRGDIAGPRTPRPTPSPGFTVARISAAG